MPLVDDAIDCLIIGGGPAGLTAATLSCPVPPICTVDRRWREPRGTNPRDPQLPGFQGIKGTELLSRLRAQAENYDVVFEVGHVLNLGRDSRAFTARTREKDLRARRVLLATGLVDASPDIAGLARGVYTGAIRYCPICDGYEALDRCVGVLGPLEAASEKATFLRTYSRDVQLFATDFEDATTEQRHSLEQAGVALSGNPVSWERSGEGVAVLTDDGRRWEVDILYPALGCEVRSDLALQLGAGCSDNGLLEVDVNQRTTIEGLYAAGDVVADLHQLSVATAHAAVAATDIHNSLPSNFRR